MSATKKNEISFPAPGPLGKITVMGFVGCHANAAIANNVINVPNNARINLFEVSTIISFFY
jgi:hypothetical protein